MNFVPFILVLILGLGAERQVKGSTADGCCLASDDDKARGWKVPCVETKYYYQLVRCSWYFWCYRRFRVRKYYCCEGQVLEDRKCLLPEEATTISSSAEDVISQNMTTTQAASAKCGQSKYPDAGGRELGLKQIIGGKASREHEFPWQVSLRVNGYSGFLHFCGGSIITSHLIVTAAHCALYMNTNSGYAVVGVHVRRTVPPSTGVYRVKKIITHPRYNNRLLENDIAVLVLDRAIDFTPDVQPICLPRREKYYYDNKHVIVSGWGKTTRDGSTASTLLQFAQLSVMPQSACRRIAVFRNLSDKMLCASDDEGYLSKDSCQGDSGGPLAYKNPEEGDTFELIGIVSWGYGCAAGYPGIYTRVTEYVDWINALINKYD